MDTARPQTIPQPALPRAECLDGRTVLGSGGPTAPPRVWATLPPARRAAIRQALLQVLREALYDAPER